MNSKLHITGIVQGVGFRPFIYQLAHRYDLNGYILNDASGVSVEIEGKEKSIHSFIEALYHELPPLARIDTLDQTTGLYVGHRSFEILQSDLQHQKSTLVSPDIAICDNCLQEMNDPNNRRYAYPFINCTDCGPRYSIMQTLPYDRPYTSMHTFVMCDNCHKEYSDPHDRRFHAQPISCPDCGPVLKLLDANGKEMRTGDEAVLYTVDAIRKGHIVALKGLGGFHLVCDATNTNALEELRKRKHRPAKPFAVMFPDIEMIEDHAEITKQEAQLITSKEKPIVLVSKKTDCTISHLATDKMDRIGVFLPYTPLHYILLKRLNIPLVATSANLSDEPIIRNSNKLIHKLGHVADLVLDHDRDILNANDDSVVQMAGSERMTLRMSRGYAPKSMKLPTKSKKKVLAVGANQKNSIALILEDTLILSPYIGDMNSLESFEYFERTLDSFKRFYDFEPDIIVHDKHPEYMTSKWAKEYKAVHAHIECIEVQHHYAHMLSGMAEFQLDSKVLGFAFDGTGYGDDGTIWGGEVMIADNYSYERIVTLAPFRLLGREKAIKEPRRSALALLFETYDLNELHELKSVTLDQFSKEELKMLHHAWKQEMNAPLCSSMGRLFDAVASLADILHVSSFEGESGLLMEQYVDERITAVFPFEIKDGIIDIQPMIGTIIHMKDKKEIISTFFNTLIEIIFRIASDQLSLPLLFTGGVFQNSVLVEKISIRCKRENVDYYIQNETPVNDGGIALGQAWYALHHDTVV